MPTDAEKITLDLPVHEAGDLLIALSRLRIGPEDEIDFFVLDQFRKKLRDTLVAHMKGKDHG